MPCGWKSSAQKQPRCGCFRYLQLSYFLNCYELKPLARLAFAQGEAVQLESQIQFLDKRGIELMAMILSDRLPLVWI